MKMFAVFVTLLYVSQHASALKIYEGVESVLLPCYLHTFGLDEPLVVWSRSNLRPSTVHQRQVDGDQLKDQNQDYRGRTSMKIDALRTADLSLTLRTPTTRDSGNYTCIIRGRGGQVESQRVTLEIKERPVNWIYIFFGVCCLLVSLAAAVHSVILCKKQKKKGGRLRVLEMVVMSLLSAVAVVISGFFLHKGIEDPLEPLPDWFLGLLGLMGVLMLLLLLTLPCYFGSLGLRICKDMKNNEGRYREQFKVLLVLLVLLGLLWVVAFAVSTVFLYKWIKNTQVSWHGDTAELYSGRSVILPCEMSSLPGDPTVTWSRHDLRPSTVHQKQQLGDDLRHQNQDYSRRTSMKTDALTTGHLSLTLWNLRPSDSGNYTCIISAFGNERTLRDIQLKVKEKYSTGGELFVLFGLLVLLIVFFVVITRLLKDQEVNEGAESVQLPFKTRAHLSEDVRVEWMDEDDRKVRVYENGPKEPDQVYRGRTEMNEDLLRTGDLSLTLKYPTVRDTGDYTCRVYNKDGDLLRKKTVSLWVKDRQVEVEQGAEFVQLPFKIRAHLSEVVRVEWTDKDDRKVHVYENGPKEQDQVYRGRTEMSEDLLRTGDLSLTLRHLKVRDRGDYTCRVYNKDGDLLRKKTVSLKVKGRTQVSPTDPSPLMANQSV